MTRCASLPVLAPRRAALATLLAGALAALAAPAGAQVHRLFPAQALRGRFLAQFQLELGLYLGSPGRGARCAAFGWVDV